MSLEGILYHRVSIIVEIEDNSWSVLKGIKEEYRIVSV